MNDTAEIGSNADYSKYRILAVDDHQLSLKLITRQLEIIGFQHIDLVMNGSEALAQLAQGAYDIVVFDWAMPVMDGATFLRTARQNPAYDKIAFMMISSETQPEIILDMLQNGATSYVPKPVTMDVIKEKIDKVIEWVEESRAS